MELNLKTVYENTRRSRSRRRFDSSLEARARTLGVGDGSESSVDRAARGTPPSSFLVPEGGEYLARVLLPAAGGSYG
eukprot:3823373-Prymnesium_polylepis.1